MPVVPLLIALVVLLLGAGVLELRVHRRNLRAVPIRIHVNGTRGKSSVTRLIAAGLREGGITTCAKTTGTLPRMILPDGRELPVYRPAGPNVIEQKRIVAAAVAQGAQALVVECMALQPQLQALSEFRLIRATHAVITNARPDHLDVMGPTDRDVALALAGMIPPGGQLFTSESRHLAVLRACADDRGARVVAVPEAAAQALREDEMARFTYTEHRENVALALAVCDAVGVPRETALRGMWQAAPDPGALRVYQVEFFGRKLHFYNAFAANDPVSTAQLWELASERHPDVGTRIALFNCRADRPERSVQLGESFARWSRADHVVLIGTGTYVFARAALAHGAEAARFVFAEGMSVAQLFERLVALVPSSAVIVGMGNIAGPGLPLVQYFSNRTLPSEGHPS